MKKIIILLTTLVSSVSLAMPEYLKDGKIAVTLKDGSKYEFSANEYMVVKRGAKAKAPVLTEVNAELKQKASAPTPVVKRHKNILSIGAVRSTTGFHTDEDGSRVNVTTKKSIGGSIQYQRNVMDDAYIGGQVDTNGGAGVSVGVGF